MSQRLHTTSFYTTHKSAVLHQLSLYNTSQIWYQPKFATKIGSSGPSCVLLSCLVTQPHVVISRHYSFCSELNGVSLVWYCCLWNMIFVGFDIRPPVFCVKRNLPLFDKNHLSWIVRRSGPCSNASLLHCIITLSVISTKPSACGITHGLKMMCVCLTWLLPCV